MRRRRPRPDDKGPLDEVFLSMRGERHYLWRAVDQAGHVLDILVQRQRDRRMQGFKSPGHAQRFLSAYGPIAQHFRPRRHLLSAPEYRDQMQQKFEMWGEITGTIMAA